MVESNGQMSACPFFFSLCHFLFRSLVPRHQRASLLHFHQCINQFWIHSFIALGIYRAITVYWAGSGSDNWNILIHWWNVKFFRSLRFFPPYFRVFLGVPASQADLWVFLEYSGFWGVPGMFSPESCVPQFLVYCSWFYKLLFAVCKVVVWLTCWLPLRS